MQEINYSNYKTRGNSCNLSNWLKNQTKTDSTVRESSSTCSFSPWWNNIKNPQLWELFFSPTCLFSSLLLLLGHGCENLLHLINDVSQLAWVGLCHFLNGVTHWRLYMQGDKCVKMQKCWSTCSNMSLQSNMIACIHVCVPSISTGCNLMHTILKTLTVDEQNRHAFASSAHLQHDSDLSKAAVHHIKHVNDYGHRVCFLQATQEENKTRKGWRGMLSKYGYNMQIQSR